jgi:RNA-directed DNA polymerase
MNKAALWQMRGQIVERLAQVRLRLHERQAQVVPTEHGVPWLGFVVYPTHRRLKRRKVLSFARHYQALLRAHRSGAISFAELDASVQG